MSKEVAKIPTIKDDSSKELKFYWEEFVYCDGTFQTLWPSSDSLALLTRSTSGDVVMYRLPVCQELRRDSWSVEVFQFTVRDSLC